MNDVSLAKSQGKTLVVAQQKGGVGKTASLVHLAFNLYEKGLRVAVVDLDTQGNASYTLKKYKTGYTSSQMYDQLPVQLRQHVGSVEEPCLMLIESDPLLANMEKRDLGQAGDVFKSNILALHACGIDVVLIDTAPAIGTGLATALYAANFVMSPIELDVYSIQGIEKMSSTIAAIRKVNQQLEFIGMMPSKVDGRNPAHKEYLSQLKKAYPTLVMPVSVGLRSSISLALAKGVPVWEIKKTAARKAADEMRALSQYVIEKMNLEIGNE